MDEKSYNPDFSLWQAQGVDSNVDFAKPDVHRFIANFDRPSFQYRRLSDVPRVNTDRLETFQENCLQTLDGTDSLSPSFKLSQPQDPAVYCELANLTLPLGSAAQAASQVQACCLAGESVAQGTWSPKDGPAHPSTDMQPTTALPKAVSPLP